MEQRCFFSLSAITSRIQQILQPAIGKLFWVKAEISSGRERGGTFYCDLVETNENKEIIAQMRCTIWSGDLMKISQALHTSTERVTITNTGSTTTTNFIRVRGYLGDCTTTTPYTLTLSR